MSAAPLDGKAVAARIRAEVAAGVRTLGERGVVPGLAAVLVGDDPASGVYVRSKGKASCPCGWKRSEWKNDQQKGGDQATLVHSVPLQSSR